MPKKCTHRYMPHPSDKDPICPPLKKRFCLTCKRMVKQKPKIFTFSRAPSPGQKHDKDKPRWSLLPWAEVGDIVRVLTYGAREYGDDNWQKIPHWRDRYFSALIRHLTAWWNGEKLDSESGLSHLAHAGCCLLFLMFKDKEV